MCVAGKKPKRIRYSTLSFCHTFEKREKVFFAHCFPYTYTDLQKDLASILERAEPENKSATFIRTRDICLTLAGNR